MFFLYNKSMKQVKEKMFFALLAFLLAAGAAGCSTQCVLMHSECYDVTGKAFAPKPDSQEIPVLDKMPERPSLQIGVVKVEAPWGTTDAAIKAEMLNRARRAGADALVVSGKEENKDNKVVFCGKVFDTRKSVVAQGLMIVYTDKGPNA